MPSPGDAAAAMTPDALAHARAAAATIADEAAELALSWFHRRVETEEKGARDLVSEADRDVEELIADRLSTAFPDDALVGEEGAGADGPDPQGRRRWYIDPIDGTTNFLKGLPAWGISIGLTGPADELLVGVIAMPVLGLFSTAARGQGAARNGVPLRASTVSRIDRVLMSYGHVRQGNPWGDLRTRSQVTNRLIGTTLGTRMNGCSVADSTFLAGGELDGLWAGGQSPWDIAAGLVILREAGVRITDVAGQPVTTLVDGFLASAPAVHDQLRALLEGSTPSAP